jgi:parallel beta-helix repeat protein
MGRPTVRQLALSATLITGLFLGGLWHVRAATAATYYVATNGNDSRSCDTAQTIGTPKQSIGSGIRCLSAGDTLYIRGGTYNEVVDDNNIKPFPQGSSWNNAVTIAGYPNEIAILHGSGDHTLGLGQQTWYVIFDNIVIDGSGSTFGVSFFGSTFVRFQNSEVKNAQASGILSNLAVPNFNEYLHLKLHHNGSSRFDHGIYLEGQNNLIDGCEMYNNIGYGIHIYNGGGGTGSNTIRNNSVHNNLGDGGVTLSSGNNHLFYNNIVYNNNGYGITIGFGGADNTQIYNNTIYGNSYYAINLRGGVSNTKIRNNIFFSNNSDSIDDFGSSGTVLSNNLTSNPLFVDATNADFHLQVSSTAINAGMALSEVSTDLSGRTRPQGAGYDIGAYEYYEYSVSQLPTPKNLKLMSVTP